MWKVGCALEGRGEKLSFQLMRRREEEEEEKYLTSIENEEEKKAERGKIISIDLHDTYYDLSYVIE